jgi:hypothetical protein
MCGTTATAGEIIITIEDGSYVEEVKAAGEEKEGVDYFAPQRVEIDKSQKVGFYEHEYQLYAGARTTDEGPECQAAVMVEAKDPGLFTGTGTSSHTWTSANGWTRNEFEFAVYNTDGTDTELIVPIIAEGTLTAKLYHQEHGNTHNYIYEEPSVLAQANINFYEYPYVYGDMPIGGVVATVDHNIWAGDVSPAFAEEKKPWLLTVPLLVGKNAGDYAFITVVQVTSVNGKASAFSPEERYYPERLFYSKVAAWAEVKMVRPNLEQPKIAGRNTADAEAAALPAIYIDPTWEHADKFGIAFPDNVTPLTEEWDELVFADGFDNGFTLLWSSTVP